MPSQRKQAQFTSVSGVAHLEGKTTMPACIVISGTLSGMGTMRTLGTGEGAPSRARPHPRMRRPVWVYWTRFDLVLVK